MHRHFTKSFRFFKVQHLPKSLILPQYPSSFSYSSTQDNPHEPSFNSYQKTEEPFSFQEEDPRSSSPPDISSKMSVTALYITGMADILRFEAQPAQLLEKYFNHMIAVLTKFQAFSSQTKTKSRDTLLSALQYDFRFINKNILEASQQDIFDPELLDLAFQLFRMMGQSQLQNRNFYDFIVYPFLNSNFLQQSDLKSKLKALRFIDKFDPSACQGLMSPSFLSSLTENYENIIKDFSLEEYFETLDNLTRIELKDKPLKNKISKHAFKQIESGSLADSDVLKLFVYLCRGDLLERYTPEFKKIQTKILAMNFLDLTEATLLYSLMFLDHIHEYSPSIHSKFLTFYTQNPDKWTEIMLFNLMSYNFYKKKLTNSFIKSLESFIINSLDQQNRLSISTILKFCHKMISVEGLEPETFQKIQTYFMKYDPQYSWTASDLQAIFSCCIQQNLESSPLYKHFEPEVYRILKDPKTNVEDFLDLINEYAYGSYVPNFSIFHSILERCKKGIRGLVGKNQKALSLLVDALCHYIINYSLFADRMTKEIYKRHIAGDINLIVSSIFELWDEEPTLFEGQKFQGKLFQFMFTIFFEFPEVLTKHERAIKIIRVFKDIEVLPKTPFGVLEFLKSVLENMGLETELNKKEYIYSISALVKPNIAILLQSNREKGKLRKIGKYQMRIKRYHLSKLGYKVVIIQDHEFKDLYGQSLQSQKVFFNNRLFSKKL